MLAAFFFFFFLALFVLKCELYLTGSQSTTQADDFHTPQASLCRSGGRGSSQTGPNTSPARAPSSLEMPSQNSRILKPPKSSRSKHLLVKASGSALESPSPGAVHLNTRAMDRVCLATYFRLAAPYCAQAKTGHGLGCLAADRNSMETFQLKV